MKALLAFTIAAALGLGAACTLGSVEPGDSDGDGECPADVMDCDGVVEVCDESGDCAASCPSGLVDCGGACIDPATDASFCGAGPDCSAAPGVACEADETCTAGECVKLASCLPGAAALIDGCQLLSVCGSDDQEAFAGGDCSDNTAEFADWWCQLAGYPGALRYTEVTEGDASAVYYTGGAAEVLSHCSQAEQKEYAFDAGCTGVRDLVCAPPEAPAGLRSELHLCGHSSRDVTAFIPDGVSLDLVQSCSPGGSAQAMLVTRHGAIDGDEIRAYLQGGGVVVTEFSKSHEVWSAVFPPVASGAFTGSCWDVAPTVVQFTPDDPFWAANEFVAIDLADSGCGFDVGHFPVLTPLAGWSSDKVSIGYRNLGLGRLWVAEFDWQDMDHGDPEYSKSLLGAMITGRR